jgi:hypothetical protein
LPAPARSGVVGVVEARPADQVVGAVGGRPRLEHVGAGDAGHRVVPEPAVEGLIAGRADDHVVERRADPRLDVVVDVVRVRGAGATVVALLVLLDPDGARRERVVDRVHSGLAEGVDRRRERAAAAPDPDDVVAGPGADGGGKPRRGRHLVVAASELQAQPGERAAHGDRADRRAARGAHRQPDVAVGDRHRVGDAIVVETDVVHLGAGVANDDLTGGRPRDLGGLSGGRERREGAAATAAPSAARRRSVMGRWWVIPGPFR